MMSVNTQRAIIKDIQGFRGKELKTYLKSLIDTIDTMGDDDVDLRKSAFLDLKDFLDVIADTKPTKYHELDTLARDYFMEAYLKMHI
jgi:CRISPR/Cas system CSM-associated protein Csm2 small subunit